MLIGRHRARVDIEIRVELAQADLVAARLQDSAKRRRSETFAEEDTTPPVMKMYRAMGPNL